MDNVVTLETAKRLKQAGFPQPEPKVGQFWYDGMFQRLSIASHRMGKDQHLYLTPINAVDWSHYFEAVVMLDDKNDWPIFAPTATDILCAFDDSDLINLAILDTPCFVEIIVNVEKLALKWIVFNTNT